MNEFVDSRQSEGAVFYSRSKLFIQKAEKEKVRTELIIKISREFAHNALETGDRSMIIMGAGINHCFNSRQPEYDYRDSISVWFRSLLTFRMDASFMSSVPVAFQLHLLSEFIIFTMWTFTRLVHVWSVPLSYIGRSYILFRIDRSE